MNNSIKLFSIIVALFIPLTASSRGAVPNRYSIVAIHAYLYYQSSGEISKYDLLDGKHHELWNTIVGEGEAKEPSGALWLLVEIEGPGDLVDLGGRLALEVTGDEKKLLSQTLRIDDWNYSSEKLILPFIVYGTGCETIEMHARLEGIPEDRLGISSLIRTIDFRCGE